MPHTLLYGGTFDPIHLGHLITCQRAAEILSANRVLFLPAQISPHKTTAHTTPAHHRLAMLKLATESNPAFAVDDRELHRPPPSYTFDTLASLRADHPAENFTLLLGSDQLPKLHTWHRIRELLQGPSAVRFAVLARPDLGSAPNSKIPGTIGAFKGTIGVSEWEKQISEGEIVGYGGVILRTPLIEISATEIRNRVAAGLSIEYLVPLKVAAYIAEHQLYRPIK